MNKDKSFKPMVILTCFMYVMQAMFTIVLILINVTPDSDAAIYTFIGLGIGLGFVGLVVALINAIMALIGAFQKDSIPPTKTSMIAKLVLMPFYCINFFYWFLLVAGFCNPWLFLGVPIIIGLAVVTTYCYMISTSAPNLFYLLRLAKDKQLKYDGYLVTAIVFNFVFILDVVGAIMLYRIIKKSDSNQL